jgi:DNA-3-methyladenine glycosylase II
VTRERTVAAAEVLAASDPVMAGLVTTHGPCRFGTKPRVEDRFAALASSICSQQLAGAAARTIWGRVQLAVGTPFTAEAVLATSDEALRAAGLSGSKVRAVRDLAAHVADGRVDVRRLGRLDDDAVVASLVPVRGVGRWTAEMFCIFALHRLDVWPVTDLGVRHGHAAAYDLPELLAPADLAATGESFRPFRSVAAWYFWRESDAARLRSRKA